MDVRISHILFDAARMEEQIESAKKLNPEFDSLYRGQSEENLASVAPYIFTFSRNSEFETWYFEKGWGDSWGVIVNADEDMKSLHKHFRKFLMVQTEEGEELYFRFYNPRVLRIFLPTCDKSQIKEFFGNITCFLCEDEDPQYGWVFSQDNGTLIQKRMPKEAIKTYEPEEKKRKFSFF